LGGNLELRSKTKVFNTNKINSLNEISEWNYDGSSTNQAHGKNSEVFLKPVKYIDDPFRGGNHIIVLCETYDDVYHQVPNKTNFR